MEGGKDERRWKLTLLSPSLLLSSPPHRPFPFQLLPTKDDNPTPLRLNITDLSATQTISLLTSLVPPPTTSMTSSSSQNISTTSPSEPSTSIPLGQGKELWEHVWKSRNLDTDKTKYLWRGGERVRVKSKDELLAEGKAVRGPGQPGAKRKWTNGRFTMGERKEGEGEGEEEEPRVV